MRALVIGHRAGAIFVKETPAALEDLQQLVGGFIEAGAPAQLRELGIEVLVDEEGLLKGYPPNENLYPFFYAGTAVMIGFEGEEFVSLTDKQLVYAMRFLDILREERGNK